MSKGSKKPIPRAPSVFSSKTQEILGIGMIGLGVLTIFGLQGGDTGFFGHFVCSFLRAVLGQGAWGCPPLLIGFGVLSLRRLPQLTWNRLAIGIVLIFLSVIGSLSRSIHGDYFEPYLLSHSGGYLGAFLGWLASTLLGKAHIIGFIVLGMTGLCICLPDSLLSSLKIYYQKLKEFIFPPKQEFPLQVSQSAPKQSPILEAEYKIPAPPLPSLSKTGIAELPTSKSKLEPLTLNTVSSAPKEGYLLPPLSCLNNLGSVQVRSPEEMQKNIQTLVRTLDEFNIEANVLEVATGPTITRYEIQLGPGIRVSKITSLADNIAMGLAASHVRVEAPIPGKSAIGVEVPNAQPSSVSLREMCESPEFIDNPSRLWIALGKDVSGTPKYFDITKMPHLLIGGATNSGKSIGLATLITSLLLRNTPKDLKMVMIDPKRVELSLFDGIPHLMYPVVKDVKEAPGVLRAVWREMDRRYDLYSEAGVRNIDGWNEKASFQDKMSYIVVVIDELADLMIQAAAEVETSICRLAQLARATGIHLIIATQRPSVDVITGTIKANIASRMAFAVSSQIDSRTILDQAGADKLIGRGDMLFFPIGAAKPTRIQGCYVSEAEIEAICTHWKEQEKPEYILNPVEVVIQEKDSSYSQETQDPLWEDAVRWIVERGEASTSMLQRRFSIGFQRASRLIDSMEEKRIVGPKEGSRPRETLVNPLEVEHLFTKKSNFEGSILTDDYS